MPHCAPPSPSYPLLPAASRPGLVLAAYPQPVCPPQPLSVSGHVALDIQSQGCRVWGLHSLHLNGPSPLGPEVTAQQSSAEGAPCCGKHNTAWGIRGDKLERRG